MTDFLKPEGSNLVAKSSKGTEYVVSRLVYRGALSEPYTLEIDLYAQETDASSWLGQEFNCNYYDTLGTSRDAEREFHGVVTEAQILSAGESQRYLLHRLTLKPWFALLEFNCGNRVFQEKSTEDIVTSIFSDLGFKGKYSTGSLPSTKRAYCLQFEENDQDYVERLLAEEGIHYYFEQDSSSHKLVLHDASLPFDTSGKISLDHKLTATQSNEILLSWQPKFQFHTSGVELSNYDYSKTKLTTSKTKTSKHNISNSSKLTQSHFPTPSVSGLMDDLASRLVKSRLAQAERNYQLIDAETNSVELVPGRYVSVNSHPDKSQQGDYLITEVEQVFFVDSSSAFSYQGRFTCVPKDNGHYPESIPKPKVQGMQSAVVAGKKEDEPASDDQGRIRIKFHWDTDAEGDKTSCWVRVAQSMAGNGYGLQFIPRAEQEVLVSFIDGDPDQPVVTGTVYNSKHAPPYKTTDTTQSGIKTQLAGKSNEIRFDDKKDNEQLYFHAAKDMLTEVENDATKTVTGEQKTTVTKDVSLTTEKNYTLTTTENINQTTKKNFTLTATDDISEKGKNITLEADTQIQLKVGDSKITITSSSIKIESTNITVDASSALKNSAMNITNSASSAFKASGTTLALDGSGSAELTSKGSVKLDSKASLTAQGAMSAELKSNLKASLSGSVMSEVKGAIVKIN
ncbi:type VI secretion system Vgr family protein [Litoribrevibacter euphylliae]|uniref:Type VI secretion system Vgr family protein n=1 Tax=Litoribrevibacter euphylliae TaxID=1834034 RepID=A0ABV7HJ28_9GAMM